MGLCIDDIRNAMWQDFVFVCATRAGIPSVHPGIKLCLKPWNGKPSENKPVTQQV